MIGHRPSCLIAVKGEREMKEHGNSVLSRCLRRATITIVASGIAAASAYAKPANNLVVVAPTDLPDLARQAGEAMVLSETLDGRTLLYIEHYQGAQMAFLDVTDPQHIRGEGSAYLGALGPFDFVSPLDSGQYLVRLRQGQAEAVLDVRKERAPKLTSVQAQTSADSSPRFRDTGYAVTSQAADVQRARDNQMADIAGLQQIKRVPDWTRVREQVTNVATGTTFLLTEDGLYVIRRPDVEMIKRFEDQKYSN
jgi:hypothetical protein